MLVNFDGLTLLINWISWCNLKYKKKRNYRSDFYIPQQIQIALFWINQKNMQTNLNHLWWGRKKLCFKHKNTVGLQIFVCRSIRTLDISPFPLPRLAPPSPPLNKRKKSRTENVMNAYQQHRWRDFKKVELFTLRNINWHQGHSTCLV